MAARIEDPIVLQGWPRGLNLDAPITRLELDELSQAMDVVLGPRGELEQRPGTAPYSVYTDAEKYTRLRSWITSAVVSSEDLDEVFLAHRSGTSYGWYVVGAYFDGVTTRVEVDTTMTSENSYVLFVNGKLYMSDGTDAVEIDPTVYPAEMDINIIDVWDVAVDGNTTSAFVSYSGTHKFDPEVIYERVFAKHDEGVDSEDARHRLWWSEPLLPLSWETTNFIDINPNDGNDLTAVKHFADQVVVFKEHSVWGIAGRDFATGSDLQLYQIDGSIGTTHPRTIVEHEGRLYFLDRHSGIYAFDGSVFENFGRPVFRDIQETLPDFWDKEVHAWIHENRYHLAIPNSTTTRGYEVFVCELETGGWTQWREGYRDVEVVVSGLGESTFVLGVCDGVLNDFEGFHEISSDHLDLNGEAIVVEVRTGWIQPDHSIRQHRLRQVALDLGPTDHEVILRGYADFADPTVFSQAFAVVTVDASTGTGGHSVRTHALNGHRWRALMLQLQVTTDGTDPLELRSIALIHSVLKRTRGDSD